MDIMGHIRDVKKAMDTTKAMLIPIKMCTALLRKHGITLDKLKVGKSVERDDGKTVLTDAVEIYDYLEQAPSDWDTLVNKAFAKKEVITQPILLAAWKRSQNSLRTHLIIGRVVTGNKSDWFNH